MAAFRILAALLAVLCAVYFYNQETFSEDMVRGKRVLVTGASSGIGEQMAYEFARLGAHVMVTARREERLQQVVQKCRDLGAASASYVASDMGNLTLAERVVGEAKNSLGGLDILVLNHVGGTKFGPFEGTIESVITCMTVNFFSYAQLTISAMKMLTESQGSIIAVSSVAGRQAQPFTVNYSAAKFALEGFYAALRAELRLQKVNVPITVAVLGYIDTDTAVNSLRGKMRMEPSPKEDCAREIVRGGALRQREVFYPYWSTKLPLLFRDWAPEFFDRLIADTYIMENIL